MDITPTEPTNKRGPQGPQKTATSSRAHIAARNMAWTRQALSRLGSGFIDSRGCGLPDRRRTWRLGGSAGHAMLSAVTAATFTTGVSSTSSRAHIAARNAAGRCALSAGSAASLATGHDVDCAVGVVGSEIPWGMHRARHPGRAHTSLVLVSLSFVILLKAPVGCSLDTRSSQELFTFPADGLAPPDPEGSPGLVEMPQAVIR